MSRKRPYNVAELDTLINRIKLRVDRLEELRKRLAGAGKNASVAVDGHQSLYTRGFKSFDLFINKLAMELDLEGIE